jgi:parallel beta-helix repeat protein
MKLKAIRHRLAFLACFAGFAAPVLGGVLVVNPADPSAFSEIQTAVDAAVPGDTILVHDGIYQPVKITTDSLTVKATATAKPIIDAMEGQYGVLIQADGVTIQGLDAHNALYEDLSDPPWFDGTAFMVRGHGNILTGNTASGSIYGIAVYSVDDDGLIPSIGNRISGNTSTANEFAGFGGVNAHDGVWIQNTSTDNVAGFLLASSEGNRLVNNAADRNGMHGFWVTANVVDSIGCSHNEFSGNSARDNALSGFRLLFATDNALKGNRSEGNGRHGFEVVLSSTGNTFSGIQARDNGEWGVFRSPDSLDNKFSGTSLKNNGSGDSNAPLR